MKFFKENYERFYAQKEQESAYGEPAKIVKRIPDVLKSGAVLDVGAGDGRHARYLASKGFEVKALDISEAGLEKLQRLAKQNQLKINTGLADLSQWSFDADYDAIVAVQIFQHLQTKDALRILSEIQRHTRPNGVNAISLFTKSGDRYLLDREEDPDAFYPDDNWLKESYAGWEILEHELVNAPLIGKLRADGTLSMSVTERILAKKLEE